MSGGTGGGSSNLEPSADTGGSSAHTAFSHSPPARRGSRLAALSVLVGCQGLDAEDSLLQELEADGLALLAAAAAALEDRPRAELSLTLCDSDFIRGLNAQWRGKDCATDVLSFPQDDAEMLGDVCSSRVPSARALLALAQRVHNKSATPPRRLRDVRRSSSASMSPTGRRQSAATSGETSCASCWRDRRPPP